jgi:hypothetical protein
MFTKPIDWHAMGTLKRHYGVTPRIVYPQEGIFLDLRRWWKQEPPPLTRIYVGSRMIGSGATAREAVENALGSINPVKE